MISDETRAWVRAELDAAADAYRKSRARYVEANNRVVDAYERASNVLDRLRAEVLGDSKPPRRMRAATTTTTEGGEG